MAEEDLSGVDDAASECGRIARVGTGMEQDVVGGLQVDLDLLAYFIYGPNGAVHEILNDDEWARKEFGCTMLEAIRQRVLESEQPNLVIGLLTGCMDSRLVQQKIVQELCTHSLTAPGSENFPIFYIAGPPGVGPFMVPRALTILVRKALLHRRRLEVREVYTCKHNDCAGKGVNMYFPRGLTAEHFVGAYKMVQERFSPNMVVGHPRLLAPAVGVENSTLQAICRADHDLWERIPACTDTPEQVDMLMRALCYRTEPLEGA